MSNFEDGPKGMDVAKATKLGFYSNGLDYEGQDGNRYWFGQLEAEVNEGDRVGVNRQRRTIDPNAEVSNGIAKATAPAGWFVWVALDVDASGAVSS